MLERPVGDAVLRHAQARRAGPGAVRRARAAAARRARGRHGPRRVGGDGARRSRRPAPSSASRSCWSSTTWLRDGHGRSRHGARLRRAHRRRHARRGAARPRGAHGPTWEVAAVNQFVTLFVGGLFLGAIYSLVALGFVIVFKATHVINFAQGSVLLLGAYVIARCARAARVLGRRSLVGVLRRGGRLVLIDVVLIRRDPPRRPRHAGDPHARRRHRARDRAVAPDRHRRAEHRRAVGLDVTSSSASASPTSRVIAGRWPRCSSPASGPRSSSRTGGSRCARRPRTARPPRSWASA